MTTSTLQRLIKYPHSAVFDKDPLSVLVFRLWHDSVARWSIHGGSMAVEVGTSLFTYDLSTLTVTQLIDALRADGMDVQHISSRFDQHSALVLVDADGDQLESNGDHVYAFTSLMWALFSAYSREIDRASYEVQQALLQMVLLTAEGEWLDLWGTLYAVARVDGETDSAYRIRIPREAFRVRVNARAIELAIKDLTGKDVVIYEPWVNIFTLDQSLLSGGDMLQGGDNFGPFLIQPRSAAPIDWSDVLPIVERNRPAGVKVLPPQVMYAGGVSLGAVSVGTAVVRRHAANVQLEDVALLDYAEIEEVSVLNHNLIHTTGRYSFTGVQYKSRPWPRLRWGHETWRDANVGVGTLHFRLGWLNFTSAKASQYTSLI